MTLILRVKVGTLVLRFHGGIHTQSGTKAWLERIYTNVGILITFERMKGWVGMSKIGFDCLKCFTS